MTPQVSGLDGYDQWLTLAAAWPGPRKELIYNINDALRFFMIIIFTIIFRSTIILTIRIIILIII